MQEQETVKGWNFFVFIIKKRRKLKTNIPTDITTRVEIDE